MAKKRTRVRQTIPINESKEAAFIRVVTPRVNKAVKSIKVIGYCAAGTYAYTPEQVQQILVTLDKAFQELSAKFSAKADTQNAFEFTG